MPKFSLKGKVALVAGASRGIGQAAAETLAQQGCSVIVASRNLDSCNKVADHIRAQKGIARAIMLHIGDQQNQDEVIQSIESKEGRLDILVNCGATNPYFGPVLETPIAALEKTIGVNLSGPFYLSIKAARMMVRTKSGSIINIASVNGLNPGKLQGIYSITKAALINMTKVFAQELGAYGIRVNALAPGLTKTRLASALLENTETTNALVENAMSIQRIGDPQDMANAILYLASDEASYVTGQTLTVDGGLTTRGLL